MSDSAFSQPAEQKSESHKSSDKGIETAIGKASADACAPGERPQDVKNDDTAQKALPRAIFDGQSIVFGSGDSATFKTDAEDNAHQNHPGGDKLDQHDLSPKKTDAAAGVPTKPFK